MQALLHPNPNFNHAARLKDGAHLILKKKIVFLVIPLLGLALIKFPISQQDSLIGKAAPAFEAPTSDGIGFSLAAHSQSIKILHFYTTNCEACREEIPSLVGIWEDARNCKAAVCPVFVNINVQDSLTDVVKYATDFSIPFPSVLDSSGDIAHLYGVKGVPETFIIDKNNVIREHLTGGTDRDEMQRYLEALESASGN